MQRPKRPNPAPAPSPERRVELPRSPGVFVVNGYSERWLRQGFPWVYPAEVTAGTAAIGAVVRLQSPAGDDLGVAIADEGWIRARRYRTDPGNIDSALILARLNTAWDLRAALGLAPGSSEATTCWRWVNGENDDLPGIRIDVWGDHVVVSLDTPSLCRLLPMLIEGVRERIPGVQSVHAGWRPDTRDGRVWPAPPGCLYGQSPGASTVYEDGLAYVVEPASKKDIGLFPDQRENRRWLARHYAGARVLNLFCYTGAFSVHALHHGAVSVTSVDLGKPALDRLDENLALNQLAAEKHERLEEDALKVLDRLRRQGRVFDRIVLDPPGHSHSAAGDWSGEQDYARLVSAAVRVCAPGGWVIASSNLGSVSPRQFQGALVDGVRKAGGLAQVLYHGGQAPDFPSATHFPEGTFLKFVVMAVRRA